MHQFLIADDSTGKTQMLHALVEHFGIDAEVVTAPNTEEAKRLIDEGDVQYAFVDYEMPSELGPAVIAHLRQKNPRAKIALTTSANSEKYRNDAMEAGADAFVCTSYAADEVEHRLRDLLEEWTAC